MLITESLFTPALLSQLRMSPRVSENVSLLFHLFSASPFYFISLFLDLANAIISIIIITLNSNSERRVYKLCG